MELERAPPRALARAAPDRFVAGARERAPGGAREGRRGERGVARSCAIPIAPGRGAPGPGRGAASPRSATRRRSIPELLDGDRWSCARRWPRPGARRTWPACARSREAVEEASTRRRGAAGGRASTPRATHRRCRARRQAWARCGIYRRFLDEVDAPSRTTLASRTHGPLRRSSTPRLRPRPIGIDLGTTNSLVAYVSNERPVAIADCDLQAARPQRRVATAEAATSSSGVVRRRAPRSTRATPSCQRQALHGPRRRRSRDAPPGPYEFVARGRGRGATSSASRSPATEVVTPVEVSPEILRALKQQAEDELARPSAAPSSPCPPTSTTRSARRPRTPARLAGLEVLRLLNEPTAAALAYGLDKKPERHLRGLRPRRRHVRHHDPRARRRRLPGEVAPAATARLGGDDIDRAIAERLLARLGASADDATPQLVRLSLDARARAKHALTTQDSVEATIAVPAGEHVDADARRASRR